MMTLPSASSAAIATGNVMLTLGSTSGRPTDTLTLETTPSIVNDTEFDVAAVTVCAAAAPHPS